MQERDTVVIFDKETEYAEKLWEFFRRQKRIPWDTVLYTDIKKLLEQEKEASILIVAERSMQEELAKFPAGQVVVLNESGMKKIQGYIHVDKYQPADTLYRKILEIYAEQIKEDATFLECGERTSFIGIYSPVKRCLQTPFALTMGQLLAREASCLYLNFEHYAGDGELVAKSYNRDLSDLLYFLDASEDKFRLRLQILREKKGDLDYIPPIKSGQDLLSITGKDWLRFFDKLEKSGEYRYIIMDLSDSMQGLFDILRMCKKIFTLTKEDRMARGKILQYEQLLNMYQYQDVVDKTKKCSLPVFRALPEGIEQYTRGDLASYIRTEILEEMKTDELRLS